MFFFTATPSTRGKFPHKNHLQALTLQLVRNSTIANLRGTEFRKHTAWHSGLINGLIISNYLSSWYSWKIWNILEDHILIALLGAPTSRACMMCCLAYWGHRITKSNNKCSQNAGRVLCKVASLTIGLNESCWTSFPCNQIRQVKLPWLNMLHLCKCCLSLYHWL